MCIENLLGCKSPKIMILWKKFKFSFLITTPNAGLRFEQINNAEVWRETIRRYSAMDFSYLYLDLFSWFIHLLLILSSFGWLSQLFRRLNLLYLGFNPVFVMQIVYSEAICRAKLWLCSKNSFYPFNICRTIDFMHSCLK